MSHLSRKVAPLAAVLLLCGAAPHRAFTKWTEPPPAPVTATAEMLEIGERVYKGACVGCHGQSGDGTGREGNLLKTPPRDFTTGRFEFRSTPVGSLPLDTDLFVSVRRGLRPETGMPAFNFLSDQEVWAVVMYVKTFSARWTSEKPTEVVDVPTPPKPGPDAAKAGQALFMGAGACFICHGMQGKGDGPTARGTTYTAGKHQGKPVPPANLTRPDLFKGGSRAKDIFRTISTGLDGTPMPGFAKALTPEQRWNLTFYVLSLSQLPSNTPTGGTP